MKNTIIGIFAERESAEKAITDLTAKGYSAQDISIIMKDTVVRQKLVDNTGANVVGGALSGVATGSAVGGLAGLLIGVGAIVVPGIGAILIGGPIALALGLTGAAVVAVQGAVTGAVAGGLLGALVGLGIPASEAQVYEDRIKEGAILVAVPAHNDEVKHIFTKYSATQVRTLV